MNEIHDKKILLISLQGIGNTILVLPIIEALKTKRNTVDVVTSGNGSSEILRLTHFARRIVIWQEGKGWLKNLAQICPSIWREGYDIAFALCPAGRRENLLLRLANAQIKRGWRSQWSRELLGFGSPEMPFWNEGEHDLNSNLALTFLTEKEIETAIIAVRETLKKVGKDLKSSEDGVKGRLRFASPPPARGMRPRAGTVPDTPAKAGASCNVRLAIQPLTQNRAKCWSLERYRNLLGGLNDRLGPLEVHILGSRTEDRELSDMCSALPMKVELKIGRDWAELIRLMNGMDFFLGVDSALAHLAAMCGIPTCILFAYTNPERISAVGSNVLVVQTNYPCCPCHRFATGFINDCEYHLRCIRNLDTSDVLDIVTLFLKNLRNHPIERVDQDLKSPHEIRDLAFSAKHLIIPGH